MHRYLPVFCVAVFVATACTAQEAKQFVNLDGHQQRIFDLGTGSPAVVFVSGFGDGLRVYNYVQRQVAQRTRTFSYDRAGLYESEPTGVERSLDNMVTELNTMLEKQNVPPPYLFVGHSYGGYIIRYFASRYPAKVAGMVMIDPSVEYFEDEIRRTNTPAAIKQYDSLLAVGDPSWPEGIKAEAAYLPKSHSVMKSVHFPKNVPITVITATRPVQSTYAFMKNSVEIKRDLHQRWQADAPQLRQVLVPNSGHYVQFDDPQLVIAEINAMLDQLK